MNLLNPISISLLSTRPSPDLSIILNWRANDFSVEVPPDLLANTSLSFPIIALTPLGNAPLFPPADVALIVLEVIVEVVMEEGLAYVVPKRAAFNSLLYEGERSFG